MHKSPPPLSMTNFLFSCGLLKANRDERTPLPTFSITLASRMLSAFTPAFLFRPSDFVATLECVLAPCAGTLKGMALSATTLSSKLVLLDLLYVVRCPKWICDGCVV